MTFSANGGLAIKAAEQWNGPPVGDDGTIPTQKAPRTVRSPVSRGPATKWPNAGKLGRNRAPWVIFWVPTASSSEGIGHEASAQIHVSRTASDRM